MDNLYPCLLIAYVENDETITKVQELAGNGTTFVEITRDSLRDL